MAVLLGAATTTAVLVGALLAGDSVRGSLRALVLDRLGTIDRALIAERFLDASLIEGAVPAILMKGTATHADTRARASRVQILGVDERFASLYPEGTPFLPEPASGDLDTPVVINETLGRELGASVGDTLLVHLPRSSDAPADTLLGRRAVEDLVATMRCLVRAVIPDRGPGRFGLEPDQKTPRTLFVPLLDLQRVVGRRGQVNLMLLPEGAAGGSASSTILPRLIDLEEMGLILSRTSSYVSVESRQFVLRPDLAERIESSAAALGAPTQRVQTYLATEIRRRNRAVPYSTISAVEPAGAPFPGLFLSGGEPAPQLEDAEILLGEWAAEDLGVEPGDDVEVSYFIFGEDERLDTEMRRFRVRGILEPAGLAVDGTLAPDYPGIHEAKDIAAWDPPFPVNLSRIRPRDEEYWDRFGATPKAFVSAGTARRLWGSRYGSLTAVRAAPPAGVDLHEFAAKLREEIRRRVPIEAAGLHLRDIRADGLRAAGGSTDFGALFLAFSMFLIMSCTLLCGLLFRLGVEQRAREIGVLLASGYTAARVRNRFLAEGSVLAGAGAAVGLPAGALYAGLLMLGLRTIWRDASGSPDLFLHLSGGSLVIGGVVSIVAVMLAIVWSLGRLRRLPIPTLLAGQVAAVRSGGTRAATFLAFSSLGAGLILLVLTLSRDAGSSPALAFGIGAAALVSGLAFFARWCRAPVRRATVGTGRGALAAMAARNCAWNPGRSLLSVALIASASFVMVMVAASRRDAGTQGGGRDSPTGGFELLAESEIPLHQDLDTREGRLEAGLDESNEGLFAGATVIGLRVVPGDDASCLNLYRPERPRLLGAPDALARRGGFRFHDVIRDVDNPWELLAAETGPGVIPAIGDEASVVWILHLALGRELTVRDELGMPLRLRFVATLEGSPFQSEILISEKHLLAHFPSRAGFSYFLIDTPAEKAAPVARTLEEALGRQGFDVTPTAERIAGYRAVENTYLATFQVLGGLGLLLGTLGLGIVVLRNVTERRGELATMRAFGFTRRRLAVMVLLETLALLCTGILTGTLCALASVAPRLASGAGTPSWVPIAVTLSAVLAVGMLSALAAVRGALRAPLLPELKAER